ncbi:MULTISPECIES: YcaO-like family protein [unclassified Myroides]|uniref:YcaO-like family protein n=1 Tax=unclassified Myroides TaxID=2642485 RepID=UPI0015FB5B71|nr:MULTISPECIES: YcaO-like family protein [unclassified Myroides]MBB1150236.1 YcaO-like family protein [Myroides sp. NP-2]MDM1407322.1 YcaO-like family protein [Myroides sp. DF42-4-2]
MIRALHGELGFLNKPELQIARNLYLPASLHESVCFSDHLFVMNNKRESISGGGIAFDKDQASVAALGEYLERYASSFQLKGALIHGTYRALKEQYTCYPPNRITYFSEEQYGASQFALKRLTESCATHWIQGENYLTQEEMLLPFFMANVENVQGDGLYHKNTSTGTACHTNRSTAIEGGLLECIERDGFAKFWYFQRQKKYKKYSQAFLLNHFKADGRIRQLFENKRVKIVTYDCSDDAFCPTFVVFILFKKRGKVYQSIGAASRLDKKEALIKAVVEAYQGIEYTEVACEKFRNILSREKISAFDFSEIDSFKKHFALYNLYPELAHFVPLLSDVLSDEHYATTWEEKHPHHLQDLTATELVKKGISEVYIAHLSTVDTLQLGFEVIKVITPQLNLLTGDFNYPYLGLFDPNEDLFTDFPHPFP